jgi:hypothetical protein
VRRGANADASRGQQADPEQAPEQPRQKSVAAAVAERQAGTEERGHLPIRLGGVVAGLGDVRYSHVAVRVVVVCGCVPDVLGELRLCHSARWGD